MAEWKAQCKKEELMDATEMMGYAKIGFTYGITYFRKIGENFKKPEDLNS